MKIIVSACLLGVPCRYDGKSKPNEAVCALADAHELIPICPEVMGRLQTPREPSEIQQDGSVKNRIGQDVSEEYTRGAEEALRIAREQNCTLAILKEKSPSCGVGRIYDGSFTGTLCEGNGICAARLLQNGIRVLGESQLEEHTLGELLSFPKNE